MLIYWIKSNLCPLISPSESHQNCACHNPIEPTGTYQSLTVINKPFLSSSFKLSCYVWNFESTKFYRCLLDPLELTWLWTIRKLLLGGGVVWLCLWLEQGEHKSFPDVSFPPPDGGGIHSHTLSSHQRVKRLSPHQTLSIPPKSHTTCIHAIPSSLCTLSTCQLMHTLSCSLYKPLSCQTDSCM